MRVTAEASKGLEELSMYECNCCARTESLNTLPIGAVTSLKRLECHSCLSASEAEV